MPAVDIGDRWVIEEDAAALRKALGRRKLILASASPRRARVLRQCRVKFTVFPVEVGERIEAEDSPSGHVVRWSRIKARKAAETWKRGLILGVDTVVFCCGRVLGKPADRQDAQYLLGLLSGRTHTVYTGMTLIAMPQQEMVYGWRTTDVRFRRLSAKTIEDYVETGEPLDKAGAYGIQEGGRRLVADIDGPLDNVVGLPVGRLAVLVERLTRRVAR